MENICKQAAELISRMVNTNDKESLNSFIEALRKDHRFLQGQEILFFIKVMKMFSEVGVDARNEREVNFARDVVKFMEEKIGKIDAKY